MDAESALPANGDPAEPVLPAAVAAGVKRPERGVVVVVQVAQQLDELPRQPLRFSDHDQPGWTADPQQRHDHRMAGQSPALRDALERCVDAGDKVGFTFLDGREFLGWVAEVDGDRALLMWASSPMYAMSTNGAEWNPDDEWVPLSTIDASTAARRDKASQRWVPLC